MFEKLAQDELSTTPSCSCGYDRSVKKAVKYIIPGGEAHEKYKEILNGIGEWAKSIKGADGNNVPIIFIEKA